MSPLIGRSLVALSLFFVLSACQNSAQKNQEPTIDEFAVAELVFNTHLAAQELESAGQQLDALRERDPSEPRLDELQQRLATAWLATGEQALKDADIDTASAALMQAKRLLPKAPALTQGLSTALAAVQEPIAEPAAPPVQPSVARKQPLPRLAPAAKKPVKKSVIAQPEAPEIVVEQSQSEELIELTPPVRSKLKARVLDLNAAHTTIALPMLASRNNHQLGRLLDDVAADVVRFRAAVSIEVADTRDFHWVAALLSARVKKLDANFNPRLQEVIRSDEAAQLVITPNLSF
ncbi:MAG: hypothetical protein GX673_06155 [Gammaproteobacteria bacterium]|nr:hypothetical protein [Gammaproteobacteria bacterium]